jgi:hypothetical protein
MFINLRIYHEVVKEVSFCSMLSPYFHLKGPEDNEAKPQNKSVIQLAGRACLLSKNEE